MRITGDLEAPYSRMDQKRRVADAIAAEQKVDNDCKDVATKGNNDDDRDRFRWGRRTNGQDASPMESRR